MHPKMVMFRRQHPKWDQNPWFVPETTRILSTFACRSYPPRDFQHLPFDAVSQSVAPCQGYFLNFDVSTQYLIAEVLYIE